MPPPFTNLFGLSLMTYTLLLGLGLLVSAAWVLARRGPEDGYGATADVLLAALVFGVIGARAGHVLLYWPHFSSQPDAIPQLASGGLNWHAGLVGALLGVWLVGRLRGVSYGPLLTAAAPTLALLSAMSWWGCGAAACAYGAEVQTLADYPGWLVWEARDAFGLNAPRYAVQPLGSALSLVALMIVLSSTARWRFSLALILLGGLHFALGFIRDDAIMVWAGLRADQWLDLGVILLGLLISINWRRPAIPEAGYAAAEP